jgi:protein-S-isoprenylcysteine O-methyltransferase Ste14
MRDQVEVEMNSTPSRTVQNRQELMQGVTKRFRQVMVLVLFQGALLFLSSGRIDWVMAWIYIGIYVVFILINGVIMLRRSPETIAERAEAGEDWKDWDKIVGGLYALMYFVIMLLVAGLDVRFGWTGEMAPIVHVAAVVVFTLGYALFSWAMMSNAFFSTGVRIQEERGQTVATAGPYRFIRHPGYLGAIIQSLALPPLLGSLWALIPAGVAVLLMITRTALEDRTLQNELEGYSDYAESVRYRLLPGVW